MGLKGEIAGSAGVYLKNIVGLIEDNLFSIISGRFMGLKYYL